MPNLARVIPAMDHIDETFSTDSLDEFKDPAICAALSIARKTLNRYYGLTDSSEVYRIAMVLHPRHKLTYFQTAQWSDEWIKTAEALVRAEFERSYNHATNDSDSDIEIIDDAQAGSKNIKKSKNIFDNLPTLVTPEPSRASSELDRYLRLDIEDVDNAIAWWHERRSLYPRLSRMALDYLTIPPTSIDVERFFSRGRLLLSHTRSRLSVHTTAAILCLGHWSRHDLVKNEDVLKVTSLPEHISGENTIVLD